MKIMAGTQRIQILDYLKGFIFILLALDHSAHSYALYWGKYHFFTSNERSIIGDILYLHNNNIIMPMLFFLVGYATTSAIAQKGLLKHFVTRIWRYVVPFILFIPTILPLMMYPRFVSKNPGITYSTYWTDHFFTKYLQAGPMWVMFALFFFTIIIMILYKLPLIWRTSMRGIDFLIQRPLLLIITFAILFSVAFTVSELIWGPYYWLSFSKVFALQGSKFIVQFLSFFIGALCGNLKVFENDQLIENLGSKLPWFTLAYITFAINYICYAIVNSWDGGAYSYDVIRHILGGGSYDQIPYIISQIYPKITIRCVLQGFFLISQMLFLLSLFARFCHKNNKLWYIIAANGYGVFLFHEIPVIWLQYLTNDINFLPIIIKLGAIFIIAVAFGMGMSMLVRKFSIVRKVIG